LHSTSDELKELVLRTNQNELAVNERSKVR
jgi:hypothetical protein